jgi:septum formation protein
MKPAGPINIVLASTSIRRKEILTLLGIPFKIVAPRFEEKSCEQKQARDEAVLFAKEKTRSVEDDFQNSIIIGSDTLIDCAGEKIGKPRDGRDAAQLLRRLQGTRHTIFTAVTLIDTAEKITQTHLEEIQITMAAMSDAEIAHYIATREPFGKAGAFSLQGKGRKYIKCLDGDYLAAVGLPLKAIAEFLQKRHIPYPLDMEQLYRKKDFLNWGTY